jgi:hypothetical protein
MKTKILCILSLLCFCITQQIYSQDPVPEDYFDLFDPDPSDEKKGSEDKSPKPFNLDEIKTMLENTGAVGSFPASAISSFKMVNENCDATYICMYNTLKKVFKIYEYENTLDVNLGEEENEEPLACYREKELLQDYALFLLTLNLDLYCIEHLHPDGNDLEDVELINAMIALDDICIAAGERVWRMPFLRKYCGFRDKVNPYCSQDLMYGNTEIPAPCNCGDYNGTLDLEEKNKVLKHIRTIIDNINPLWQAAKAVEINGRLKALPCD